MGEKITSNLERKKKYVSLITTTELSRSSLIHTTRPWHCSEHCSALRWATSLLQYPCDSQTQDVAAEHLTEAATPESDSPHLTWPTNTDLVFHRGKLLLTSQHPIVRTVITNAIENLQAAILFNNAFPDICSALALIKDCLFTAANHLKPGSANILERLEHDVDYLLDISPLVMLIYVEMIGLTTLCSHVPGSPWSEVKLRRRVAPLWQDLFWDLLQHWTSLNTFRNGCHTTLTLFWGPHW